MPREVFIYDSRARAGIGKLVKSPYKGLLKSVPDYDSEYGDFVCWMIELQKYLDAQHGAYELPQKLDIFLLTYIK